MELYRLHSFLEVARSRNLTKAAGRLNVSLSALSSQIKLLEEDLGVSLFKRGAKGMQLTEHGKAMLKEAQQVVSASQRMINKAAQLKGKQIGNLNIGINTDPGFLNVSELTRQMATACPGVGLSFIESQSFETVEMLVEEKIDVGFHYGSLPNLSVYCVPLSTVKICIVIPAGMAEKNETDSLEKLVRLPWIWTRYGCPFHMKMQQVLDQQGLKLNQATDAVEENIVKELVKSGAGAALMRSDEAFELERSGQAVIWDGYGFEIELSAACLNNRKSEEWIAQFFKTVESLY